MCEPLGKGERFREWARPKELDDGWEEARIGEVQPRSQLTTLDAVVRMIAAT